MKFEDVAPIEPVNVEEELYNEECFPYLRWFLADPDPVFLRSVDPTYNQETRSYSWSPVLGELELNEPDRDAVFEEFSSALNGEELGIARCYHPRHGLRILKAGRSLEVETCFECNTTIFRGAFSGFTGHATELDRQPPIMNAILDREGIRRNRPITPEERERLQRGEL